MCFVAFDAWSHSESTLSADDYERRGGDPRSNRQCANHGQRSPFDRSDCDIHASDLHLAAAIPASNHRLHLCRALRPLIASLPKILSRRGLEHCSQISTQLLIFMGKISPRARTAKHARGFVLLRRFIFIHFRGHLEMVDFAP